MQVFRPTFAVSLIAAAGALFILCDGAQAQSQPNAKSAGPMVERGRYLAKAAGCNDCHTPGYNQSLGQLDEKLWLTGDGLGWRGPWGTTYAPNLRLYVQPMSVEQWLAAINTMEPRPPMPWFNLRAMRRADQVALYMFLKHLGPAGQPAPAWVAPDKTPPQPYVQFPG